MPYYTALHSTMFLLIRLCTGYSTQLISALHSTMFLLIQYPAFSTLRSRFSLTFHNVSINTDNNVDNKMIEDLTLHSTMFLLIPGRESFFRYSFHALHSTMFLLILIRSVHILVSDPSLHSTMFLLIRQWSYKRIGNTILYIPQCFY